jgi:hypothetical protein
MTGGAAGTMVAGGGDGVVHIVYLSRSKYPESCKHIEDAWADGHPRVLHVERNSAENRAESMEGHPRESGLDRDEYPPAMFREGGYNPDTGQQASVRGITPGDNRGAGSTIGNACRGLPVGSAVSFVIIP